MLKRKVVSLVLRKVSEHSALLMNAIISKIRTDTKYVVHLEPRLEREKGENSIQKHSSGFPCLQQLFGEKYKDESPSLCSKL